MSSTEHGQQKPRFLGREWRNQLRDTLAYRNGRSYIGPTESMFGKLTGPTTFVIHFLPKTPEEKAREQVLQELPPVLVAPLVLIEAAQVLAGLHRFGRHSTGKERSTQDIYRKTVFISQGARDMEDFIHRMQTERRFKSLQYIHGATHVTMAAFAIHHVGFDIKRSQYGQRDTEDVLQMAKQASERLHVLMAQFSRLRRKQRKTFLAEYGQEIRDLDAQSIVSIETSREGLLSHAQSVSALRERLEGRIKRERSRRPLGDLPFPYLGLKKK